MPSDTLVKNLFINRDSYSEAYLSEWEADYKSIHGTHQSQRQVDTTQLEQKYGIKIDRAEDLYWLINCIERSYEIHLKLISVRSLTDKKPTIDELFSNKFFQDIGVSNYLEGEPKTASQEIDGEIMQSEIDTWWSSHRHPTSNKTSSELIHAIFEDNFPRAIRHSLGEYYTPSWLVNFTSSLLLEESNTDFRKKRILDPTCGSGSFISGVIDDLYKRIGASAFEVVEGFDVRWQSVLAARTNFILQYTQIIGNPENLNIPIKQKDIFDHNYGQTDLFSEVQQTSQEKEKVYDYIIGNPPWVNWEYLPEATKKKTSSLWNLYGLWTSRGMDKGFIKEDISSLATYTVADKFLRGDGQLYFVLKESLFKSTKQGEGFRNFTIKPSLESISPVRIDDFSDLQTFEGASTRAVVATFHKGIPTKFPVRYVKWNHKRSRTKKVNDIHDLSSQELLAIPSDKTKANSGWLSYSPTEITTLSTVLGSSAYEARTGVFSGGLNAAFWVNITGSSDNEARIKNITARAKNKVKDVEAAIEKDLLYPLAGGSDLSKWEIKYTKYIVLPHTAETRMNPISKQEIATYPKTLQYLHQFIEALSERKGFTSIDRHIRDKYFYTLQRIGSYTFSQYKVGWKYISKEFTPCVFGFVEDQHLGKKLLIPNEKIIYVGLSSEDEAHYLCGLLSSKQYKSAIHSYMLGTQITPGIIKKLNIPKFNPDDHNHSAISALCKLGHNTRENSEKTFYEEEISSIMETFL